MNLLIPLPAYGSKLPGDLSVRRTVDTLQVGRALAATAVVLHHADIASIAFVGAGVSGIVSHGYLGVDFFFVISGFIIYYSATQRASTAASMIDFLKLRAIRIYIPYLPVGLALALLYTGIPQFSGANREWGWLTTLTLLPSEFPPALSVAWTLRHEVAFYLIFAIAYLSNRLLLGLAAWGVAIALSESFRLTDSYPATVPVLSLINIEFFFGIFISWLAIRQYRFPAGVLFLGAIGVWGLWIVLGATRESSPLVGAGLACAILMFVQWEQSGRLSVPRWLSLLGDSSYALYLVHGIIISVLVRLCAHFEPLRGYAPAMCILTFGSLLGGIAYYVVVEQPALRYVRRRFVTTEAWRRRGVSTGNDRTSP